MKIELNLTMNSSKIEATIKYRTSMDAILLMFLDKIEHIRELFWLSKSILSFIENKQPLLI